MAIPTKTPLMVEQTAQVTGATFSCLRAPSSVSASVKGSGAVSATVVIEGSNDLTAPWHLLQTITLSGTDSASDAFWLATTYEAIRARLTAISGTNAKASAFQVA